MLEGIVVVDFSRVLAGPLCSQLLADAGARVIKIEDPARGDETRRWGPPFIGSTAAYFHAINRNKESLSLNLRSEEGREIARRLVATADVVLDNFLPSQRGLLPEIPGSVIHCSITGYDGDTPDAARPGYDLLAQAESGLMSITGAPDGDPMKSGVAITDILTAHYAFGAVASALVARQRTGKGSRLEVSLFSSAVASLVNVVQNVLLSKSVAKRHGNEHPSIVPYQVFHASDRPFVIGAGTDRHYQLLCTRVLGRADLAADRRFATNATRVKNRRALIPELEQAFRKRRAAHWIARCHKAGIPASLVLGVREALRAPAARGIVTPKAIRSPVRVNGRRASLGSPPPGLGQHTEAILRQLGYSAKEIASLQGDGVIGHATRSAAARSKRTRTPEPRRPAVRGGSRAPSKSRD